jgi:hypothetical protein
MNTRVELRGRPLMALRTGAIVVAVASGFYALAALLVGSPLEFGAGLASCGACWIIADFIKWTDERDRVAGRRPVAARSHYGFLQPQRQRMAFGQPSQCGRAGLSSRVPIRC